MKKLKQKTKKEYFDGFVGMLLILYAMGIFIQTILLEIVNPNYIMSYTAWFEIILGLLILYVSREKLENIRW